MSEETIVRQAAPTLAGIKTGSMFPYRCESREELLEDIRAFNRVLVPRGMCLLLLRVMQKSALLYLYRPQSLEKDLKDHISQELLQESGYASESCAACVRHLVERFRSGEDFPHEVLSQESARRERHENHRNARGHVGFVCRKLSEKTDGRSGL